MQFKRQNKLADRGFCLTLMMIVSCAGRLGLRFRQWSELGCRALAKVGAISSR